MATPNIGQDIVEWFTQRFDIPAKQGDSDDVLRWKAAQRAVVLEVTQLHQAQREMKKQGNATVENNSNIDPRLLE